MLRRSWIGVVVEGGREGHSVFRKSGETPPHSTTWPVIPRSLKSAGVILGAGLQNTSLAVVPPPKRFGAQEAVRLGMTR